MPHLRFSVRIAAVSPLRGCNRRAVIPHNSRLRNGLFAILASLDWESDGFYLMGVTALFATSRVDQILIKT
jgi:hypothetical protein